MMYVELYQYLILHKQLPMPGIGTFLSEKKSAEFDFANRIINSPVYTITLAPGGHLPGQPFFAWLANVLGISGREAIFRFNDFAFDLKKQISEGAVINWDGVGTLQRGVTGNVKLTPLLTALILEKPVPANTVIRGKPSHMLRVGEDEMSSAEMTKVLSKQKEKKAYRWILPLVMAVLAAIFICWNFSEKGLDIMATSNTTKLVPEEATANYLVLP